MDCVRNIEIGGSKPKPDLDRELGLMRKRGESGSHEKRDLRITLTIIELRMSGSTHDEAKRNVMSRYGLEKRTIETCFSEYKDQAGKQYRKKRSLSPKRETQLATILDKHHKELTPAEKTQRAFLLGK